MKRTKRIGILTAGGDSPGLNAAIRAVGKAAVGAYGWELIGFRDGFRGLIEDRLVRLDKAGLSGLLTVGGTILGTSRDKPHRMEVDGQLRDMTGVIAKTYKRHKLDALVCIGGGGTHKNAARLVEQGLHIVTLPKTIDNDVALTDTTIGFDTALGIATDVIDRLHSTAHSHHRIIIAEIMGHRAGWLALGAGIAGGADVILIPEIPYDVDKVAAAIRSRSEHGLNFSIVAVAEGALPEADAAELAPAPASPRPGEDRRRPQGGQDGPGRLGPGPGGSHHAPRTTTGGPHASRSPRDHPRLCAARRYAVVCRPPAREPPRNRRRGVHPRREVRPDGGSAGRRDGSGPHREGGQGTQDRAAWATGGWSPRVASAPAWATEERDALARRRRCQWTRTGLRRGSRAGTTSA